MSSGTGESAVCVAMDADATHSTDARRCLTDIGGSLGTGSCQSAAAAAEVVVLELSGTSWPAAVFLIVNAALGAGLLNFPEAYDQAGGVAVSLGVQAALMVLIVASLIVLAQCSDHSDSNTYQDTVYGLLGRRALYLCSFVVVVYCFGTCITFLIIIRDQSDVIFSSLVGPFFCRSWYMNSSFTMPLTSTLFILPLCFSRRIDFLKYSSSLGVLAIFYLDGLIVYKYFYGNFIAGPVKQRPDAWTDVFLVMPTICFGYQCHVSVIPIYSCLRRRSVSTFLRAALIAIAVCVLTYSLAGTFGYLTFGGRVSSDVLMSYDASDPAVMVGIVAISVKTYTTYPLLLFCGREGVDTLWTAAGTSQNELTRRIIIAMLWFIITVLLAALLPDIGVVIQLLGSLAAVFIFIFPGLCLMSMVLQKDELLVLTKHRFLVPCAVLFVAVGSFIFGLVLTQAIQQDIYHLGPPVEDLCRVDSILSHRPLLG